MGQRFMRVDKQLFLGLFAGEQHYRVVQDGLPPGTWIAELDVSSGGEALEFILESDEWEDAPREDAIPEINPLLEDLPAYPSPHPGGSKIWQPD